MTESASPPALGESVDLVAAAGFAAATLACTLVPTVPDLLRLAVAAPLTLFFVGYVLLALVFPEARDEEAGTGLSALAERVVLSVGLSVVTTPLLALFVSYSSLPFTQPTVAAAIAGAVLLGSGAALVVRYRTPPERRFAVVPFVRSGVREGFVGRDGRDRLLNVALVASLVFCTVAVGAGVGAETDTEPFTEFTVKTEVTGSLTAGHYPETLAPGESESVTLLIGNREGHPQAYTIVVRAGPIEAENSSGNATLSQFETVDRVRVRAGANETAVVERRLDGSVVDGPTVVRYELYRGRPDRSALGEPYRSLSLRLNASGGDATPNP